MNKRYNINSMTINDLRELIANGNDKHNNQIRVTKDGEVFLSQDVVGKMNLKNIAFRFETFGKNKGDVGPEAAKDDIFVEKIFKVLKSNWKNDCLYEFIDDFMIYED